MRRRLLPVLLPALAWLRPSPAAAEGLTLDRLMASMAASPPRRAGFTEEKRFAALDTPLESRGHLSYRDGVLEKVTDWPQPERLEVDGDRIVITTGNEPPRVVTLGMAPELRVLIDAIRGPLSGDAAALRRAFHCVVTGGAQDWALTLVPRDGPRVLRSVRLEGHGATVSRTVVVQANGDRDVMVIAPG